MRVAFCSQWFPPERALIPQQVARGIRHNGHDLEVLTGFPNYPEGTLHPGYRLQAYRRDEWEGSPVHRAPLYPSHNPSAGGRIANYLSWAAAATGVAQARVPKVDAWVVYSSPITAGLPPLVAPRHRGTPVLTMVQDLWPDSVTDSGMAPGHVTSPRVGRLLESACMRIYRSSTRVGVISPGMRAVLAERGVPEEQIVDLPNWLDDGHLRPESTPSPQWRAALGLPQGRTFLYAGNLGRLQALEPLIDAFAQRPTANLVLLGDGVAREGLQELAKRRDASNVTFLPPVPPHEVGEFIGAADVAIVSLADTRLLRSTMPSKVQASLAAARPVLAHAPGDAAALIASRRAGVAVPPGDVDGLVRAVDDLLGASQDALAQMRSNARQTYNDLFSPSAGAARLGSVLETMIKETHD